MWRCKKCNGEILSHCNGNFTCRLDNNGNSNDDRLVEIYKSWHSFYACEDCGESGKLKEIGYRDDIVIDIFAYKENEDEYAVRILYQNKDILKSGEFKDDELSVYSDMYPSLKDNNGKYSLFIQGSIDCLDDSEIKCTKKQVEWIKGVCDKINEKYAIKR